MSNVIAHKINLYVLNISVSIKQTDIIITSYDSKINAINEIILSILIFYNFFISKFFYLYMQYCLKLGPYHHKVFA